MTSSLILLVIVSLLELLLLVLVVVFFYRLKRSEKAMNALTEKHEQMLQKLKFNAELEQELVSSFETRQQELVELDKKLHTKAEELKRLIEQAESMSRSPDFLREIIMEGRRQGKTPLAIAKSTGLSVEEVEIIMEQSGP
jgi:uncharacterized protein HemX